MISKIVIFRY